MLQLTFVIVYILFGTYKGLFLVIALNPKYQFSR